MWLKLLEKIHVRSGALIIAAFFAFVGVIMIFQGMHDEGFIDIKSAIISGKIKSGFVGVTFAFLSVILSIVSIIIKPTAQKLKVKRGDFSIEWEGVIKSSNAIMDQIQSMMILFKQSGEKIDMQAFSAEPKSRCAD